VDSHNRSMDKGFMVAGIILVIVGILFAAAFPSAFYISAKEVNIDDYQDGDEITVYGTITDIEYSDILNITAIELDGNLTVLAKGHVENFKEGDYVYMEIKKVVDGEIFGHEISHWELVCGIHLVSETRFYGYLVSLAGVAVIILASVMKK